MSGILGFVQLLQTSDLSDKEKDEYFKSVNLSGKRLIETLNDIIEISRIESGELEMQENETDISEIVQFIRETYKPQAVEKNLQFRINTPSESSNLRFITDVYRLRRILSNLVKNAIKYTDEGSVELGASIEEDQVCFFVKDTGRGISADRTEAIFDRFVQADLNLTREHEGAGLGLSISKAYVEQLGGKILIKSKEKEGSTFSFSIPYKAPAKT
jgi:signal transduction histidine kinase